MPRPLDSKMSNSCPIAIEEAEELNLDHCVETQWRPVGVGVTLLEKNAAAGNGAHFQVGRFALCLIVSFTLM